MKHLITISAVMILLMGFVVNLNVERRNTTVYHNFEKIVMEDGVARARTDGYFTSDNISNLKTTLATKCDVDIADIVVTATTSPKYKSNTYNSNNRIEYTVTIPIDQIIGAHRLWGISDADNKTVYTISGSVESELLPT